MHWTDIIEVPVEDILNMAEVTTKGFTQNDPPSPLTGTEYRDGQTPNPDWTVTTAVPLAAPSDSNKYFYKGWGPADCIGFLTELGIV